MADIPAKSKLLELAKSRFDEISPAERKLFETTAAGKKADCSGLSEKDRVVRGDCLVWLCTNPDASAEVTYRGISIGGAEIKGRVDLEWARISFPLVAWKCVFNDEIILSRSQLRFLNLQGSSVRQLEANRTEFEGSVLLRFGFKTQGPVNLGDSTIGGSLDCDGGEFLGNEKTPALSANGATIHGRVFMRRGFKAMGEVNLVGATMGRTLECDGGQFFGIGKSLAINADTAKIDGAVYFRGGASVEGEARFAFSSVAGSFQWRDLKSPEKAILDLRFAKTGTLFMSEDSWPGNGNLRLDGFLYDRIDSRAFPTAEMQLMWLHRQPQDQFLSQPYDQLAAALRERGLKEDATKVMVAKNKDQAAHLHWRPAWLWFGLFGKLIGYGYRPWRAFLISLIMIGFGWLVFERGYHSKLVTPTGDKAYLVEKNGTRRLSKNGTPQVSDDHPKFNAFVYSVETFVPLLKLGIDEHWAPNAYRGKSLNVGILGLLGFPRTWGSLLRYYLWFHIIAGWVLTTLWAAGLTGLAKT
jgi:hypothetical protein